MSAYGNITAELNSVKYADFSQITQKIKELSDRYSGLPMQSIVTAFGGVGVNNPFVQNRRVKKISTTPNGYSKQEIENMLQVPESNELPLRQVSKSIEYSSYPLFHMRNVYTNVLTYHSYIAPYLSEDGDSDKPLFWREWKLLEKLRTEMDLKAATHMIAGQALQEGKVFYYPRLGIDKAHNKVNYAFLQQLPSDYVKIVGFNNKSKYTLSFDMMYFTQPGTDIRQFGDLFADYVSDFNASIYPAPQFTKGKIVYAEKSRINLKSVKDARVNAYEQNNGWFYWVELPVDKVFTFEIDDTNRNVISPFSGLFVDLLQLVAYEAVQLELVQNPLISVVLGEIPYFDDKNVNVADQYKLSNAGRSLFEALWYQMLGFNNTGGIGFFAAPLQNMKLQQLAEAPSAMEISSNGYGYTLSKAGLSGIIPTNGDTRSGLAQISYRLESRFAMQIYSCVERMFNTIIDRLGLKFSWRFTMFGNIADDKDSIEEARQGMTLGILPETMRYLALKDMSIFDDISISNALISADLISKRIPLKSSYNGGDGGDGEVGRPRSEGVTSEGQENDLDSVPAERMFS